MVWPSQFLFWFVFVVFGWVLGLYIGHISCQGTSDLKLWQGYYIDKFAHFSQVFDRPFYGPWFSICVSLEVQLQDECEQNFIIFF